MALSDVIGRLAAHLDLETASFERNASRAKREVSGLERHISKAGTVIKGAFVGMFGALAIGELARVAQEGLEYASSLGEVATQLGVTTKELQEFRYAASQAGVETGEMDQALSQLTRRLGDAAQGAKAPLAAFERLGVNIRDANGHVLDAGDAIPLIAEGLQKIESPAERAAILVDLFGKSGQKLAPLLEGGAAGVNNLRDAAHELGIVLSQEQIQKADDTADKLSAMKQVLEAKIAGAVADNADSILELADALTKLVDAAGKAAKAWRYFSNLDFSWNAPSISKQFEAMQVRDLGPGVELTPGAAAAIKARKDGRFLAPSGGSLLRVPNRRPAQAPLQTPWGPTVQPGLSRAVGASPFGGFDWSRFTPGAGGDFMRFAQAANDVVKPLQMSEGLMERMANGHGPRLVEVMKRLPAEMEALRADTQSILDRLFPEEAEVRRYEQELKTLTAAMKAGQLSTEDYAEAIVALRREFNGFADLIANNQDIVVQGVGMTLDDALAQADASWERFTDGLTKQAGTTRVQVVKSFEDLAQDVLGSLNQLSGAIRGGGFLDILSAVISVGLQLGSAGVFGKKIASNINSPVPKYASGTDFHPGGLALVGERGPELVSMPRGSSVTPNNQLGALGTTNNYFNGNLLTPEFWAMIRSGDQAAADAGAAGGAAIVKRSGRRRVA